MSAVLVTGATKGLGRETARQLAAAGHTVYAGARDGERGRAAANEIGARFIQIDVTDDASVAAAAAEIDASETEGGIDVVVNCAGVEGRLADNGILAAEDTTAGDMLAVFDTNVFGVIRVVHSFLPLLQKSAAPVIVNVSSGLGSLTELSDPSSPTQFYRGIAYPSSKSALNAITIQLAKALPDFRINAVDPGFTRTDLNGNTGTQTVEEGSAVIVRMAQVAADGPTGSFLSNDGPASW
ncbi:SDR family NAD(P)-dependent oxidoreductase [Microbacterium sp. LWS13-1.2]|uniref:SDR family NAD(P)-dependent oxidoreductase n=1 Tax=Microbacterium sp. LWS13-1.2 TaxID=3135264 RepID=A0AAU6S8T6_9MICO